MTSARKYHVIHNGVATIMKLTDRERDEMYPGAEPYEKEIAEGDPDVTATERRTRTPRNKARNAQGDKGES